MKNVIETLDRYYQSFINQQRDWDFFLGLADYVKYAVETPAVDNILKRIIQARNNDQKRLGKYEHEVIKETKEAKEKLAKIIKKHNISYESLIEEIKEYQEYEDGIIQSSQTEAEALSDALMDIIRSLFKNGYKELVKDFAIEHKQIPNEIGKYTFSKTLDLYYKEKEIFNEKLKTELWASWDNLVLAYLTVFRASEKLEELRKNEKDFFKAWNFTGLVGEMRRIRDGDINRFTGIASNSEPIHFKRENYISHASRVHNYLIKELNLKIAKEEEHKEPVEIFTNKVVPDRTAEIERQMNETRRWEAEESQKDRQHRELLKQNRILATIIDKYSHALDLIIERAEFSGNGSNFSIDYYYFNFEDRMVDSKMLEKFLTEMQKDGCFENYIRTNYAGGTRFVFIKPSVKKLRAFKEKREIIEPFPKTTEQKNAVLEALKRRVEKIEEERKLRQIIISEIKNEQKKEQISSKTIETLRAKVEKLEKIIQDKNKKKPIKETTLYLNQNGDLYREPKDKYYYPMGEKSDRYRIIRFLLKNGYKQTLEISGILNGKSIKSIQTEIYKINNIAMGRLKIKDKLIEGKKGSGYRINPKYKITFKNE